MEVSFTPIDGSVDDDIVLSELSEGLVVLLLCSCVDCDETEVVNEELLIVDSRIDVVTDLVVVGGTTVLDIVLYTVEKVLVDWLTVVGVTVGIIGKLVLEDIGVLDNDKEEDEAVLLRLVADGSIIIVPVVLDVADMLVDSVSVV